MCQPERVVRVGGSGEDEVDGVAGAAKGVSGVTAGFPSEVDTSASEDVGRFDPVGGHCDGFASH
jgi:hypothetical protein